MRNQIQRLQVQNLIRRAGRCLLALVFALSVIANAEVVQNQQIPPVKKMSRRAQKMSDLEISEARVLLDQLGYWVNMETTKKDVSLHHALIAFQKIEGRERTGVLTIEELDALRVARRPQPIETGYPHIEVDLVSQVLFVVDCPGAVLRILPISSGSGEFFTEGGETRQAVTPTGRFKVHRKVEGWRNSPLGSLYYPNYIYYGIAIHGNPSVPPHPASHGCIRIPMFASREFSQIATLGMDVLVYDEDALEGIGADSASLLSEAIHFVIATAII